MADKLYIGSKKKYAVTIEGLASLNLSDSNVDFTVEFYCAGMYTRGVCRVPKDKCTFIYDTGKTTSNTFHVVCDTTLLPPGNLVCSVVITYPDQDTELPLKETVILEGAEAIRVLNP